jgi:protein AATF/BFR2
MMGKKRDLSIFDTIEELESQDRRADGKRRKKSQADARRAVEVQHQTKIFHHLVELRILLQRALKSSPTSDNKDHTKEHSETSLSSPSLCASQLRDACNTLLQVLLQSRRSLSGNGDGTTTKKSSTPYKEIVTSSSTVRLQNTLQAEYDEHREEWKQVLNSRHKSLRLHSGGTAKSQFKVMDSSFWEQVEATLEYEGIRDKDVAKMGHSNGGSGEKGDAHDEDAVPWADFDDSKVYQELLKDFVANSADTSVIGGSAERLRASRQKKDVKKDVDRRASKGRKIRYKENPKLVNFTFPLSRSNTSSLDQDAYFQSLFGGVAARGRKE